MDPFEAMDLMGGTKLTVEPVDEHVDRVRFTIHPDARAASPQSIGLPRDNEEQLAHWLLSHLVEEPAETASIALSPEDHRILTDLGISRRSDGAWGFKLKCANRACGRYPDTCYCADGLLEAMREASTRRSSHSCSVLCWFAAGYGRDYLHEYPEIGPEEWVEDAIGMRGEDLWMKIYPGADRDAVEERFENEEKSVFDALEALTESWRYRNDGPEDLRDEVNEALGDAYEEIHEEGAVDYEPDSHECACEVPA